MSEPQSVQPEEMIATVRSAVLYTRVKGRTTKEIGATKAFHADCPCCGYRFAVDHTDAEQSLIDNAEQTLKRKVRDKAQHYFTDVWGWKTFEREMYEPDGSGYSKNKSKRLRSASIDAVIQSGAGPFLRSVYNRVTKYRKYRTWFTVLWHNAPTMGEMFFACRLGDLFRVLQGIADDSPEFANRLRTAADNALKRDGSAARGRGDGELPARRGEAGGEGFDPGSAVVV